MVEPAGAGHQQGLADRDRPFEERLAWPDALDCPALILEDRVEDPESLSSRQDTFGTDPPDNRRFVAGELDNASFAGIAKAMGAEGIVVDSLEGVGKALNRAVDLQMNGRKSTVIEIMCTRELGDPFRRDALAKPIRLLDKYKDYV